MATQRSLSHCYYNAFPCLRVIRAPPIQQPVDRVRYVATLRITSRSLDRLRREAKDARKGFYVWDTETSGLGCWISPKGKVSWCVQGRPGGKSGTTKRITFPATDINAARIEARSLRVDMAKGIDVAQRKRQQRRAIAVSDNIPRLGDAVALYIKRKRKPGRYWDEIELRFENQIIPVLGKSTRLSHISKADALDLIEAKLDAGYPAAARLLYTTLSAFFNWCAAKNLIDASPLERLSDDEIPQPVEARGRILSDDEIKTFWAATAKLPLYGPFYRLLLLTAQRRNEVGGLERSEINASDWTIPGDRTKNGNPHLVPLSPQALEVLQSIKCDDDCPYLFPVIGRDGDWTPISSYSDAKQALDKLMGIVTDPEAKGYDPKKLWRTHDLRRTARSNMPRLGIPKEHAEKVLNHEPKSKLEATYDVYEYHAEKRRALEAWANYVGSLTDITRQSQTKLARNLRTLAHF